MEIFHNYGFTPFILRINGIECNVHSSRISTIVQWDKKIYVIRGGHNRFIYESIRNFGDWINLATFNDIFLKEIDDSEWNIVAIRKILPWYCSPWGWTLFPSELNVSEHGFCDHYWCVEEKKK
jgi:hypothetical protein